MSQEQNNIYQSDAKTFKFERRFDVSEDLKKYINSTLPDIIKLIDESDHRYILGTFEQELRNLLPEDLKKKADQYYSRCFKNKQEKPKNDELDNNEEDQGQDDNFWPDI